MGTRQRPLQAHSYYTSAAVLHTVRIGRPPTQLWHGPHAVSRPQRDQRLWLDRVRRVEHEPPALGNRRQRERRLRPREALADADAGAAAERKIGEARPPLGLAGPARRI